MTDQSNIPGDRWSLFMQDDGTIGCNMITPTFGGGGVVVMRVSDCPGASADPSLHESANSPVGQFAWSPDELELVSLAWEEHTGCDSIPTIERMYDRAPSGAFRCCDPGCSVVRRSPPRQKRFATGRLRLGCLCLTNPGPWA